jgi:hypothetical protein
MLAYRSDIGIPGYTGQKGRSCTDQAAAVCHCWLYARTGWGCGPCMLKPFWQAVNAVQPDRHMQASRVVCMPARTLLVIRQQAQAAVCAVVWFVPIGYCPGWSTVPVPINGSTKHTGRVPDNAELEKATIKSDSRHKASE